MVVEYAVNSDSDPYKSVAEETYQTRCAQGRERASVTGNIVSDLSIRQYDCTNSPEIVQSDDDFDPPARPTRTTSVEADALKELEDLPSDAFSSSPEPAQAIIAPLASSVPQASLRQTTLTGSSIVRTLPRGAAHREELAPTISEAPTHHELDYNALQSWVYPTNLGEIRDYQFNIVQKGLFNNVLVALPTGLGKTFIAATIMLNWFRWTKTSQIIFVAPTKPLVLQQVDACFKVAGIPRSETTMLTGGVSIDLREQEWECKRVFFMTPQTLLNDLERGICDPKRIVLVVVDEAHRATGAYAYVGVIKALKKFNSSFRILALTATPGASVEGVQQVIDSLHISKVEIRTEESLDIRRYVHQRSTEVILFDHSEEQLEMRDLFSKTLQPLLDKLNTANACWTRDPMALSPFMLTQAKAQWGNSEAGRRASQGQKGMMYTIFAVLASLAHAIDLLNYHGIGPFYKNLTVFREETGDKGPKYRKQITDSPHFIRLMDRARQWHNDADFVGHPKLSYLQDIVMNHFLDAGEGRDVVDGQKPSATRIMVFAHFRDSAEEIARVLKRNQPMIRPHVFVGQAGSKGSDGMSQKTQTEVIRKFQGGTYNTLVATCVGEEGLDIGEVDLIICYDSSASPIRMLQRMGRTGRKRAGIIKLLLMRGKEADSFTKSKDNYQKMQSMIANGSRFTFHGDLSPRILPREAQPTVEKRQIEIPVENSQGDIPEPRRRTKAPKHRKKTFNMPDGVETGFVTASRLNGRVEGDTAGSNAELSVLKRPEEEPSEIPDLESVFLSSIDQVQLERQYQNVYDDDQTICFPRVDQFPTFQRSQGYTSLVQHSRATVQFVNAMQKAHSMNDDSISKFEANLHPDDTTVTVSYQSSDPPPKPRDVGYEQPEDVSKASNLSHELLGASRSSNVIDGSTDVTGGDGDEPDEWEDDLNRFIARGKPKHIEGSTTSSSPLSLHGPEKPFYTAPRASQGFGSESGHDSDDDLPDVSLLSEGRHGKRKAGSLSDHSNDTDPPVKRRQRLHRKVIDDSDDEDDDDDDEDDEGEE
ncbi:MAG: hypothetical protein M1825_002924 [Sarcosagium campestre]|nr:MAG: hypothetical protein M1825_002924 [Sarcosagium campestre]